MDITLLIVAEAPKLTEPLTRFGGLPIAHGSREWPLCRACKRAMQFQGQLRMPAVNGGGDRLLAVFMCQNEPGMCNEWDADRGGNTVWVLPAESGELLEPPAEGVTRRPTTHGATTLEVTASDAFTAKQDWAQANAERRRALLGHVGGQPDWLENDETPACDACQAPMRFAAQLTEGPDFDTSMNFGGGEGYVFDCECGSPTGKFLWQQ